MANEKQLSALRECAEFYIEDCLARGQSEATALSKHVHLGSFIAWCALDDKFKIDDISKFVLEDYRLHVARHRKKNGEALSVASQKIKLMTVTVWLKRLEYFDVLDAEFAKRFELPKVPRPLPKNVPDEEDIMKIFQQALTSGMMAVRDHTILEMYYATGIRRSELAALDIRDIDFKNEMISVRKGKGGRDRNVPIAPQTLESLSVYLKDLRPKLATFESGEAVFLNINGQRIKVKKLTEMVGRYVSRSGTNTIGACHVFRHAAATHMLRNGADIRYVQELLGHADISSTQIYAQVTMNDLSRVYKETHPAAKQNINNL